MDSNKDNQSLEKNDHNLEVDKISNGHSFESEKKSEVSEDASSHKEEDIDNVININLLSVIKISKYVLKNMMKQKFGRIISISSVVGFIGNPGQVNYCASKSGITGFTKSLALEVASRGITVNAIAPGYITSAMTDKISDSQKDSIISNIPVVE